MPINLRYDMSCDLLRVNAQGPVSLDDLRASLAQISGSADYSPSVPAIWDLRQFDFTGFDTETVKLISKVRAEFPAREKAWVAYVVPNQLGYGMMRILQTRTETIPHSLVCYDYEEAERWIASCCQTCP